MGSPAAKGKAHGLPERFSGDAHGTLLHPAGARGSATLAQRVDRWTERRVDLADLPFLTASLAGEPNVYLSQQRFYGWRRISQLAELGSCYLDLDCYKLKRFEFSEPEYVASCVLVHADEMHVPEPWIFATGRGLLLVWPLDPTNRRALPRWNAVQRHLAASFHGFGVDKGALDAARVFRLADTANTRAKDPSAERVRLLHKPMTPRWDFEDLAFEILPLTRDQLEAKREKLASLAAHRAERRAAGEWNHTPARRLNTETLWETRLADLQRLRHFRWFGELPSGHRDEWMLLAGTAMSWLSPPSVFVREINALAQECGGWLEAETRSRLCSVFNRANQAADGKMIDYKGEKVDPRYRFRTPTIIERLEIDESEMREAGLRALVTKDVRREIEAADKRKARRAAGVPDRETWRKQVREESAEYQRPWEQLGVSRRTWYRHGCPDPHEPQDSANHG
jgi:hypothetical protein